MPKISKKINHSLPLDKVKSSIAGVVDKLAAEYPSMVDSIDWNADKTSANVKGKLFKGNFAVTESEISVDIDLSLMASPFKGKIEEQLDTHLKEFQS